MLKKTDCRWENSGSSDGALRSLLLHSGKVKLVRRLNPIFVIDGKPYAMFTHLTVPVARFREPRTTLLSHHDDIVAALDMLFQGF